MEPLTFEDIIKAAEELRDIPPRTEPLRFYTAGTGIPDQTAIDYWKDSGIIVVDRNWQQWLHGKPINPEGK